MSNFGLDASEHDIFLSLAINAFKTSFGGELIRADGTLPFHSHRAPCSPIIEGYRADAIISLGSSLWVIEVKSFEDLNSSHSVKQFEALARVMSDTPFLNVNIFVFGSDGRNVVVPRPLLHFISESRVIINVTELSVKVDE